MQQATVSGSRSTVLQPLLWLTGILASGLLVAGYYGLPYWVLVIFAVPLGLSFLFALFFYALFAFKNPDLLRSERYSLSKMALEKTLIGDSSAGLTEVFDVRNAIAVEPGTEEFKLPAAEVDE